jgi:uncharacterized protein (DUF1330 family)
MTAQRYQEFMTRVKPALEQAGGRYLARGGAHIVYEGDWQPRRVVLLAFPSIEAWESFYRGCTYQGLKAHSRRMQHCPTGSGRGHAVSTSRYRPVRYDGRTAGSRHAS